MDTWLTDLNERLSSHRSARLVAPCVFCLALAAYLIHFSTKYGLNTPPTTGGDEADYDSLGWELAHGRGYQFDYADPAFRAPYEAAARDQPNLYALPYNRVGKTTYRPPLFPMVLAGTNRAFGRQYWAARVVNAASLSAVCALVAHFVFRVAGLMPAALGAAIFVLVDYRTRLCGRAILTEAIAALLVALMTVAILKIANGWGKPPGGRGKAERAPDPWIWLGRIPIVRGIPSFCPSHPIAWMIVAGMLAGLAMLARSTIALWLPGLIAIVYWRVGEWTSGRVGERATIDGTLNSQLSTLNSPTTGGMGGSSALVRRSWHGPEIVSASVFLASALVVLLPWMVRNCLALEAFMPLGVQGMNELSAGYGDEAFARQGVWFNTSLSGFFDVVDRSDMSPLEFERAQARYSGGQAMRWIAEHPGKALLLAPLKVYQEFRPRSASELFVLGFALVGLPVVLRQPGGWVFPALVLTCAYTVAITWSVGGRFLVPLLFVFHVMAAVGVWRALLAVTRLQPFAKRRSRPSAD